MKVLLALRNNRFAKKVHGEYAEKKIPSKHHDCYPTWQAIFTLFLSSQTVLIPNESNYHFIAIEGEKNSRTILLRFDCAIIILLAATAGQSGNSYMCYLQHAHCYVVSCWLCCSPFMDLCYVRHRGVKKIIATFSFDTRCSFNALIR